MADQPNTASAVQWSMDNALRNEQVKWNRIRRDAIDQARNNGVTMDRLRELISDYRTNHAVERKRGNQRSWTHDTLIPRLMDVADFAAREFPLASASVLEPLREAMEDDRG